MFLFPRWIRRYPWTIVIVTKSLDRNSMMNTWEASSKLVEARTRWMHAWRIERARYARTRMHHWENMPLVIFSCGRFSSIDSILPPISVRKHGWVPCCSTLTLQPIFSVESIYRVVVRRTDLSKSDGSDPGLGDETSVWEECQVSRRFFLKDPKTSADPFVSQLDKYTASIIDRCFENDRDFAVNIIRKPAIAFYNVLPLKLALKANSRAFLACKCVQKYLDNEWYDFVVERERLNRERFSISILRFGNINYKRQKINLRVKHFAIHYLADFFEGILFRSFSVVFFCHYCHFSAALYPT